MYTSSQAKKYSVVERALSWGQEICVPVLTGSFSQQIPTESWSVSGTWKDQRVSPSNMNYKT